mmetsp:Transcript_19373/g.51662  ORF Transcript_19373/g.51662 Transcript_19373/m.51662 type:complete len:200 (+) Transcript_19373:1015-1614(+)
MAHLPCCGWSAATANLLQELNVHSSPLPTLLPSPPSAAASRLSNPVAACATLRHAAQASLRIRGAATPSRTEGHPTAHGKLNAAAKAPRQLQWVLAAAFLLSWSRCRRCGFGCCHCHHRRHCRRPRCLHAPQARYNNIEYHYPHNYRTADRAGATMPCGSLSSPEVGAQWSRLHAQQHLAISTLRPSASGGLEPRRPSR